MDCIGQLQNSSSQNNPTMNFLREIFQLQLTELSNGVKVKEIQNSCFQKLLKRILLIQFTSFF